MKHGINCECDECYRISSNEGVFYRCDFCDKTFESRSDADEHFNQFHKEKYYKEEGGGGSIRDIDDCLENNESSVD